MSWLRIAEKGLAELLYPQLNLKKKKLAEALPKLHTGFNKILKIFATMFKIIADKLVSVIYLSVESEVRD